jgi:transcriptional regulator with XRE-family HTH domain
MAGVIAIRLDEMKKRASIKARDIAQLLDTTPETISRWQTGKAEPQRGKLEKLLILEWILSELSEFYEPSEAKLWLFSPHRLLEGKTPADLIQEGRTDDVLAIIHQLRDGAYV